MRDNRQQFVANNRMPLFRENGAVMFGLEPKPLESQINRLYDRFRPTARRFGYNFSRPTISVNGKPNVVFLGNHSSGKSTFINHLLDGSPVQDTGVAPTDDGFTVILHGSPECDVYGPAALARLPSEFSGLAALGPTFLQRLRVKVRSCEVLKTVNLIDSPGMVDSARGASQRDYDFMAAVRQVSEISDLVLFLFDPDKPGTTGETVSALSQCLAGMEFKLRILMNKCDTFDSMFDFARAYGALCWNLAHVLPTKDLPTVYTTYLPVREGRAEARVDLADFDRHRGTVTAQIQQASQRREDNVIAAVQTDFSRLVMQVNMIVCVRRKLLAHRAWQALSSALWTVLAGAAGYLLFRWWLPWEAEASLWNWRRLLASLAAVLLAGLVGVIVSGLCRTTYRRHRAKVVADLDEVFEEEYAEQLAPGGRSDLRQHWQSIRDGVRILLTTLDHRLPAFTWSTRRKLDEVISRTLPALARPSKRTKA